MEVLFFCIFQLLGLQMQQYNYPMTVCKVVGVDDSKRGKFR